MARARATPALALCALFALSCRMLPLPHSGSPKITEDELRTRVFEAAGRFNVSIASTADAISQQSSDRTVRRRALLWKIRMTPLVQAAVLSHRATESLLDLLVLATVQRQYLTDGAGSDLFGAEQDLARSQAVEIDQELGEVARTLLDEQKYRALDEQVEQLSAQHPIRGEFEVEAAQRGLTQINSSASFDWVLRAPLAPFRALEGVESGAAAIHEFNGTAREFTALLSGLPQRLNWQLELLLYDVEDRDTVREAMASLQQVAQSSERFSRTAEELPVSLRTQLSLLLSDSQTTQTELRRTLADLNQTISETRALAGAVHPLAETLERTTAHVERAGTSWDGVVRDVQEVSASMKSGDPNGRPFDVLDYERTAAQVGTAAVHVRDALAQLPGPDDARSWLDLVFWRVLLLIVTWFGLRLVYQLVTSSVGNQPLGRRR